MSEISNEELKVLKAFKDIGEPAGPKAVAEKSGIPKDDVSKIIKRLKKDEYIMSPKRCYYALGDRSKNVL